MGEKFLCCFQADAFDLTEFGRQNPAPAALAVESDCEAMALIADLLNEPQHGRAPLENHGFVFAAGDVNDLLFLCDARQRLIYDVQFVER